jgi:phage baseplate assembly protein V
MTSRPRRRLRMRCISTFPDGAVLEYEPASGALSVTGIKTADVQASESITASTKVVMVKAAKNITLDTPEVDLH